jgi:ABC-2 type transport system ATP-binding protein
MFQLSIYGGNQVIEVVGLKKSYGDVIALNEVNLKIASGEIVGLLGPNGAGKSTLIKNLTGFIQPDQGSIEINGVDVISHPKKVQRQIGYLPESAPLYPELSVQNYLRMMADLRGISENEQLKCISEAVCAVGLENHLTKPIGHLSKGFRQRVGLAQAILHKPELLILDEPTVGLDPTQIIEIRQLIRRLAQNSTILFSTHILPEVETLCDRVIILMNGEIKMDAKRSELSSTNTLVLVLNYAPPNTVDVLKSIKGVKQVNLKEKQNGRPVFKITAQSGLNLNEAVYHVAVENDWVIWELKMEERTLETIFNELTMVV